jgi:Tol biopolymer transport system component
MKRAMSVFCLLVLIATNLLSQKSDFPKLPGPYLGQKPPGLTPEIFAPGVISTDQFEFCGTFSPDGKEFFFTRRPDYEGSANRIYYTHMVNNIWTEPVKAPFSKDVFEFIPIVFPDGKKLIFYSEMEKPLDGSHDGDLWFSDKTEKGWSEAQYFSCPANKKYCMMVSSAKNGTIYFSGMFEGKRGVFRSKINSGSYMNLEYLPEEINSLRPVHPFISPDESYLIMDAQLTGMGKPELFISFHNADGSWTKAVNMGSVINSTKTEFGASVSPDGKYLFFHRRVNGNGDIYWVSAEIIKGLRPKE